MIARPDHGQDGRDPVPAVEHVHRVLRLLAPDEEDGHDGGQQPEGTDDEREEDPGLRVRPAGRRGDGVDADAEDHRADVLGRGGLEQVGATAGAVADVVPDEVGDHARVAGVVLRDALLDLADEVGAHVGGLRVDPAAELGEEGDEGGTEAEADDEEWRFGDRDLTDEGRVEREDAPHAQEGQGDHEEARHRASAHGDLDGFDQAPSGRRRGPHVRPDGDEHADDARGHRARRTDDEGDRGHDPDRETGQLGHIGDVGGLDQRDDDADQHRSDDGQDGDRRVLAADEGDRALVDRAGHVLHRLGAGITGEDVPGQVQGEQDRDDPGRQDDQLELTGVHQDRRSSTLG